MVPKIVISEYRVKDILSMTGAPKMGSTRCRSAGKLLRAVRSVPRGLQTQTELIPAGRVEKKFCKPREIFPSEADSRLRRRRYWQAIKIPRTSSRKWQVTSPHPSGVVRFASGHLRNMYPVCHVRVARQLNHWDGELTLSLLCDSPLGAKRWS